MTLVPRSRRSSILTSGLRVGLASFVVASGVRAVGASSPTHVAAQSSAATTTLNVWYAADDPTESALTKAIVRSYQSAHSNVHVALSFFALDDMNLKLQLALSANRPPDVIYSTPRGPGLQTYVRTHQLLNLTSYARANNWGGLLRTNVLGSYNDSLAPSGRAKGTVYAAPYAMAAVGILYNKRIFSRLHLAVPTTFTQFEQAATKVKAAGLTPLGFGNADGWVGDDWYLTLVNSAVGGEALRPELQLAPRFNWRNAPFHAAGAILQKWTDQGWFTNQFSALDAQDSVTAFFGGHTAMQLISSTQNGQIVSLAASSRTPVGVFAFPSTRSGGKPISPQSGFEGWAIPKAGSNHAAAAQFITTMLSTPVAKMLVEHGLLPAHRAPASFAPSGSLQQNFMSVLEEDAPGVYLDGAPVPNLNATMEANVQLLLQKLETPDLLTRNLQQVYDTNGARASATRTDGEF